MASAWETWGVSDSVVRVALLGGGTVGSQVARLLTDSADDLQARVGAPLELVGVAVRDLSKPRPGIPADLLTDDPFAVVKREDVDIVVEVMGGIDPTKELLETALRNGASVITANKALLSEHGAALHEIAHENGVDLFYEAAVAGAIPLLRPLRESLAGDQVQRVLGIVNGTTNYILTKMDEEGADYGEVLAEAQRLGYAEADPTADVEGHDAAAKAAILATLAFHSSVTLSDVYCEGISSVTLRDVEAAKDLGFVIKLLAVAERTPDGQGVVTRVHPAMVARSHPLASVRDAFNAVFVEAESAGQMMFYGRGAGGEPTASAVLGDLVTAARNRRAGAAGQAQSVYAGLQPRPIGEAVTRYTVNLDVADRPGVLAQIATCFGDHDVSIQTVRQDTDEDTGRAALLIRTHSATEAALSATVTALRDLDSVNEVVAVMRVEGDE
ncbi:MAG: homoserine dehydrogenase [Actinobacteria bacterium]|nr:homoserine dehydrogenase [Actinomycetota bacterium]MCB8996549.1 homoserine dehydrogenase [Actinomycetota bacterium]MCB9415368.1 homoserine dehydrogenase [Actinomycetota bacterium]